MVTDSQSSLSLDSETNEATSENEAVERIIEQGYSDGLPVIPPTPERVESMLESIELKPDEILGTIPERNRVITAEKAAVNAVMAGCKAKVFPVVVAAIRGVCDPRYSIHGPSATTAGTAVLIIVNGPIIETLNFNNQSNLFAPGNRTNATVGRAVNLILRNTGGAREEEFDRACFSHPGRYSYCIAENEHDSPWTPFHVQRGFDAEESTVTVFAGFAPNQAANNDAKTAEAVLSTVAARMSSPGILGIAFDSEVVVVIGGEHMGTIAGDGWDKPDIQEFLAGNATISQAKLKKSGMISGAVKDGDETVEVPLVNDPDNVFVLAAGGQAGPFTAIVPGWTGRDNCRAVTVGIPGHASKEACTLPDIDEMEGS